MKIPAVKEAALGVAALVAVCAGASPARAQIRIAPADCVPHRGYTKIGGLVSTNGWVPDGAWYEIVASNDKIRGVALASRHPHGEMRPVPCFFGVAGAPSTWTVYLLPNSAYMPRARPPLRDPEHPVLTVVDCPPSPGPCTGTFEAALYANMGNIVGRVIRGSTGGGVAGRVFADLPGTNIRYVAASNDSGWFTFAGGTPGFGVAVYGEWGQVQTATYEVWSEYQPSAKRLVETRSSFDARVDLVLQ